MLRWSSILLAGLLAFPALAQEEEEAKAPEAPPIREIVEAGNYLFQRAFEDRDARALADLYTEDARIIPPGAAPVVGREAIAAFWQAQMETIARVELRTDDVESDGDLAAEHGNAGLFAADGSETRIQYVVVWKRIGRRWHLHRDIWNAAPAAAEPAVETRDASEPADASPDALATEDPGDDAVDPDAAAEPEPEPEVDLAP